MNCLWLSILDKDVGSRKSFHMILVKEDLTWEEAVKYCKKNHRDLVTISTKAQQKEAKDLVKEADSEFVWLGAYYTCFLELWRWTMEGDFMVFTKWKNRCQASECGQAAAMEKKGHQWVKKSQRESYNFICEVNAAG